MIDTNAAITLQVHNMQGQAYDIQLTVDERAAQGTLSLCQTETGTTQQHTLSALRKSRDGKTLQCSVGIASATLTIQDAQRPPQLHLQAKVFVPIMDEHYTLHETEQQRLRAWLQTLQIGVAS